VLAAREKIRRNRRRNLNCSLLKYATQKLTHYRERERERGRERRERGDVHVPFADCICEGPQAVLFDEHISALGAAEGDCRNRGHELGLPPPTEEPSGIALLVCAPIAAIVAYALPQLSVSYDDARSLESPSVIRARGTTEMGLRFGSPKEEGRRGLRFAEPEKDKDKDKDRKAASKGDDKKNAAPQKVLVCAEREREREREACVLGKFRES
jgi:hypothetical protein